MALVYEKLPSTMMPCFQPQEWMGKIQPVLDRSLLQSRSSQCSTTGVTKAMVCALLFVEKNHLLLIGMSIPCGGSGFPLPYV